MIGHICISLRELYLTVTSKDSLITEEVLYDTIATYKCCRDPFVVRSWEGEMIMATDQIGRPIIVRDPKVFAKLYEASQQSVHKKHKMDSGFERGKTRFVSSRNR